MNHRKECEAGQGRDLEKQGAVRPPVPEQKGNAQRDSHSSSQRPAPEKSFCWLWVVLSIIGIAAVCIGLYAVCQRQAQETQPPALKRQAPQRQAPPAKEAPPRSQPPALTPDYFEGRFKEQLREVAELHLELESYKSELEGFKNSENKDMQNMADGNPCKSRRFVQAALEDGNSEKAKKLQERKNKVAATTCKIKATTKSLKDATTKILNKALEPLNEELEEIFRRSPCKDLKKLVDANQLNRRMDNYRQELKADKTQVKKRDRFRDYEPSGLSPQRIGEELAVLERANAKMEEIDDKIARSTKSFETAKGKVVLELGVT